MVPVKRPQRAGQLWRRALLAFVFVLVCVSGCGDENVQHDGKSSENHRWIADLPEYDDPYFGVEGGATAFYSLSDSDLFSFPFPTDLRRDANGRIDLAGFPDPKGVDLLSQYIVYAESTLHGFSANGGLYVRFEHGLDTNSLPDTIESAEDWSSLWLIDADINAPTFGARTAMEWEYHGVDPAVYLPDHLLMARPVPGLPLREGGTYAFVVRRKVLDVDGRVLTPPEALRAFLLGDEHPEVDDDFVRVHMPLLSLARAGHLNPYEVAVATVFTVGRFTDEMRLARNVIHERPPPRVSSLAFDDYRSHYALYVGTYQAPNFQHGEKPYPFQGGQIESNRLGIPEVAFEEEIRFALAIPESEPPEGGRGWPLVLYGHGTGGDYLSFTSGGKGSVANRLAKRGVASLGIDLPLHGTRWDSDQDLSLLVFNVTNPDSSRANFRQSAIDFYSTIRMARETLEVPGTLRRDGEPERFDPSRVGYFGHSQGGLAGALFVPFESDLRAVVLSGAGGGLTQTVILRKDPLDILGLLAAVLEVEIEELSALHPVLTLVQSIVDVTDPINYAPYLIRGDYREGAPIHVFLTEGVQDELTPAITTESLAAAAGISLLSPPVQTSDGLVLAQVGIVQAPVSENLVTGSGAPVTAALLQDADHGHYLVFDNNAVADKVADFLESALYDVAVIP